jgi:ribosomal protein L21E
MKMSAIEQALDKVKKPNIQKLEEPKQEKAKKSDMNMMYDDRPRLYLNDKEMPTMKNYKAGDKVVLVCECTIKSMDMYDRMEGKESKKSMSAEMCIEAMADITKG